MDLDLGVLAREGGQDGCEEGVHPAGTAGPVAVVKVDSAALQDEGSDAVL